MRNSLVQWNTTLMEEDHRRLNSDSALDNSHSVLKAGASTHKVFTYETNEFFIPFQANAWFFPYFCFNFIDDNLQQFSGEKLTKYYSIDEYETLLRKLRDRIRFPRIAQDIITTLMIALILFVGATLLQYFLSIGASQHDTSAKGYRTIWICCLVAEVALFGLSLVLRAVVNCRIDTGLSEANKVSGLASSLWWQREGKFLKLKVVQNNLNQTLNMNQTVLKSHNMTSNLEVSTSEEHYYKLT